MMDRATFLSFTIGMIIGWLIYCLQMRNRLTWGNVAWNTALYIVSILFLVGLSQLLP